jgi:hypothetical protein
MMNIVTSTLWVHIRPYSAASSMLHAGDPIEVSTRRGGQTLQRLDGVCHAPPTDRPHPEWRDGTAADASAAHLALPMRQTRAPPQACLPARHPLC